MLFGVLPKSMSRLADIEIPNFRTKKGTPKPSPFVVLLQPALMPD